MSAKYLLFIYFLIFPYFLQSQTTDQAIVETSLLVEAHQLSEGANYTTSLNLCEELLPKLKKEKDRTNYVDLLATTGKNLSRINRLDEAILVLSEAKSILEQELKTKDLRYLKVLNELTFSFYMYGDCNEMLATLDLSIELFENATKSNLLARTYDLHGMYWGDMEEVKNAEYYFNKALSIRQSNQVSSPLDLHFSMLFLSKVELSKGNYLNAIKILEKALEIVKNHQGNYLEESDVIRAIAHNYALEGNYDLAIMYLEEGLRLVEAHHQDALFKVTDFYNTMANVFRAKKDSLNTHKFYKKTLDLLEGETSPVGIYEWGAVLNDYSILLINDGKYKLADSLLNIAFELFQEGKKDCGWNFAPISQVKNTQANLRYQQEQYEETINVYKQNIDFIQQKMGANSLLLITPLNNIGLTYNSISQYDSAAVYYAKAYAILSPSVNVAMNFAEVNMPIEYSYLIWNMAENFHSKHNTQADIVSLKKAFYYFNLYVEFIDYLRNGYREEATRIGFAAENKIAYEKCLEIIFELQKTEPDIAQYEKTFSYLEKSKSLALLEAIKSSQVVKFEGISQAVLAKENSIRSATQKAENIYFSYKKNFGEKTKQTQIAKSNLFNQKSAYEDFLRWLEKNHTEYYKSKYRPDVISLASVQYQQLEEGQCMLNYYVGDYSIYIAFISKTDYKIIQLEKDFPLTDWINQLQHGIISYYKQPLSQRTDELYSSSMKAYIKTAQELYEKLITPISTQLTGFSNVIIIPDGELANIPFESLLKGQPASFSNFDSYPFLIRDFQLAYCYSATLLAEMEEKKHHATAKENILALAPFSDSQNEYTAAALRNEGKLFYSGEEAIQVVELWGGKYQLGPSASKDYFIDHSGGYKMLHLSTHGVANTEEGTQSFLAFSKKMGDWDSLYVRDLYNLQLNADIVVLSACETNLGELKTGEGIISIARAFAYAGTKSILATLWTVDDQASKNLTIGFYTHLKNNDKAKALHLAKKDVLNASNNKQKHPFFWAAMVPIGDMNSIME